ncbi:unnamed protein product [Moneuplotes crassus]|uniref:Homeobox domain-containing protein n=1 Tax=Euplotes crassus TaxID=5936 RepID=A0AAD1U4K2_EUPCR|nr:unnamed protein product [Moneuplotes crassus]
MEIWNYEHDIADNINLFEFPYEPCDEQFNYFNYQMLQDELCKDSTESSKEQNIEISETRKKNDADDISEDSNFLKTVEEIVRSEIEAKGLDAVVQECSNHCFLGKSKPKNPKVKRYVRDRSDKTPLQVQAMVDALAPGQKQLVKSKRVKLGKKIGLSESQIYKWYYDTYSRAV